MTAAEFNEKYKKYKEENFYGLDIDNEDVVEYLDILFPFLIINYPDFKYQQIKTKFGRACFYCKNLPKDTIENVEMKIESILNL